MEIPKPAGSTWTDDQWAAISRRGRNMLVAAAAGSGKTAVLVERIIRRISDERNPLDVDRLLVATFTNAAAAEMRERIRDALERELAARPDAEHLRRQLALMNRAQITTLHSFCLEVIRRYFQLIRLDPGFRIANETEAQLMRLDVLEELFEERYETSAEDSAFWRLADLFGGERGDDGLYRLVQQLYDQSRSHPWPELWLSEMTAMFRNHSQAEGAFERPNIWQTSLLNDVRLELQGAADLLDQAAALAEEPGGPAPYLDNLREETDMIAYLQEVSGRSWGHLFHAFQSAEFGRLKACKGKEFDAELIEQAKELRNRAKERLGKLREELFTRSPEEYAAELAELAPLMETLVELVNGFADKYAEAKSVKGLVDFADLEHYCLQILRSPEAAPGELLPSAAALDFREQFAEVLLDEYQDTNQVQEAIVELISRERPGNRFMVGDVKQSIYRFRLAEPGLFLQKYRSYKAEGEGVADDDGQGLSEVEGGGDQGLKIDLACNFRSRGEVVDGVNFIFRQIMNERVGEINYDDKAELVRGAEYPDLEGAPASDFAVELTLLDRIANDEAADGDVDAKTNYGSPDEDDTGGSGKEGEEPFSSMETERQELETAQLEARFIASRIRGMMGMDGNGSGAFQVFDKRLKAMRSVTYRDIVILLRATRQWAPILIEELRQQGIPAYAELSTGYFEAVEIEVMLSLLRIIDNPYQDIPLAAVLRSPIVGLSAEQLAQIRVVAGPMPYYDALLKYAGLTVGAKEAEDAGVPESVAAECGRVDEQLQARLQAFVRQLEDWRQEARQGPLADLIWKLFGDTGYFDFVGGMPGGLQRQANLRALYDRARQYEATSFRGLFRFLRFIERMKDSGGDLGTARALGEQEDVVRIMSIHKSKGLEFPVVFVAGLAKMFNRQDLNGGFLLHKELGFGPKFMDAELRVSYPTLPALAIRRRMRMELLAEEMRVLYVALTRAREKLVLVAAVKSMDKLLKAWGRFSGLEDWLLPEQRLAEASCYLDWIGPAIIRHPHGKPLRERAGLPDKVPVCMAGDRSVWRINIASAELFWQSAAADVESPHGPDDDDQRSALLQLRPVGGAGSPYRDTVVHNLSWQDPRIEMRSSFAKTSVSEIKRLSETAEAARADLFADEPAAAQWLPEAASYSHTALPGPAVSTGKSLLRRPRFMEQRLLTPAERGTVFHSVMQHIPLDGEVTEEVVAETVQRMLELELLTSEQAGVIMPSAISAFFRESIGNRLQRAGRVYREVPFSYGLSAAEVYRLSGAEAQEETVLIQGVIDCLFVDDEGLTLLDYKTDAVYPGRLHELKSRYRVQLDLYARAVEHIWRKPVTGKYLYFFDGGHLVEM